jgi:hypothetical protein
MKYNGVYYNLFQNKHLDQFDFFDYILSGIESNFIKEGSIIILDNYGIHTGSRIKNILKRILAIKNIKLIFIPW